MAYVYAEGIGQPASVVLDLPVLESIGFVAYRNLVNKRAEDARS